MSTKNGLNLDMVDLSLKSKGGNTEEQIIVVLPFDYKVVIGTGQKSRLFHAALQLTETRLHMPLNDILASSSI